MLRNFLKTLGRYKAASILNILGLGVAFAAFAIIAMQVKYDLTYDRFHKNGEKIFRAELVWEDGSGAGATIPRPAAVTLGKASPQIEHVGIMRDWRFPMSVEGFNGGQIFDQPMRLVSEEIFDVFDFEFIQGDKARLSEPNTVVIPKRLAEKLFPNGDAVGSIFEVHEEEIEPQQIVAVYENWPDNSVLSAGAGDVVYVQIDPNENINSWNNFNYNVYVKLTTADVERAQEDLHNYTSPEIPEERKWMFETMRLTNIKDLHFDSTVQYDYMIEKASKATTYTLLSIGLLIILIAAINFVNFATSMVPSRLRAVNTRRVLGSTVGAIRREMIVEAVGMAVIALGMAMVIVYSVAGSSLAAYFGVDLTFGKNLTALGMTAVVAAVTGLVAGLYPAYYIASFEPALVLKGSFGLSPKGKRLRTMLISVQYVISLVLIIVALSVKAQGEYLKKYPLGFERDNLLTMNISDALAQKGDAFREELMKNPAVLGVEYSALPLVATGAMSWGRYYNGEDIQFDVETVSPGLPKLLGLEFIEGRDFLPGDDQTDDGVFIFNETAQKQYGLTSESRLEGHREIAPVVGIVKDFRVRPLHYATGPFALFVFGKYPWRYLRETFIRIAPGDEKETIQFIHDTTMRMDPNQPDVTINFLDAAVGNLYEKEQRLANLITIFSLLAVFISIIGVFGLVLFETQYRRKEIGLRKVHGASVGEVLSLINKGFVWIVLACFVVAAPLAYYAVHRWLEGFAYAAPVQWWVFVVALAAVMGITILTVTLQALKTATENPVNSIKTE